MTIEKIRWAFLGTSPISHTVAKSLLKSNGSELVAVFGRDTERLKKFQQDFNVPVASSSMDAILSNPDIDAVYIALPNHLHAALSIQAIKHKKHVLCEKSLDVSMSAVNNLMGTLAKEKSIFFSEAFMHLRHPFLLRFHAFLATSAFPLGEIKYIIAYYNCNIAKFTNVYGKGAIYNLGCYPVSLLHLVVESVYGDGAFAKHKVISATGKSSREVGGKAGDNIVETTATVEFECGVTALLETAETFGKGSQAFEIIGTNGKLWFNGNPYFPSEGETNTFQYMTNSNPSEPITVSEPATEYDPYYYQFKEVEESVKQGRQQSVRPAPSWQDSVNIMNLLTEWENKALKK